HTVASAQFLAADAGRMPKAIVVGLPVEDPADRQADFVPPVAGGSADTFTAFLRDELIPWVEARHRTRPFRVLIGHSLSGLFATYLLNSQPELFSGYIAIDPSLHVPLPSGEAYVTETDDLFERTPGLAASWYMTLSNVHALMLSAVRRLDETLESAETSDQFRWAWKHMPTETHMSVPARSVYDGLEWIFSGFDPSHFLEELRADGAAVLPRIDEQYRRLSRRMGWEVPPDDGKIAEMAAQLGTLEGKVDDALEITRVLVDRSPGDWEVQGYRGLVLLLVCDVDAARMHREASLELARESLGPESLMVLALIQAAEGFENRVQRECVEPGRF
ncbi:MAG: alpha/beta hydrolase-fold protein, partial [Gemmatimonadota bacterium]